MARLILQQNLLAENDFIELSAICNEHGIDVEPVNVIPFTTDLPEFSVQPNNLYYGSTTFINNVHEQLNPVGVFYDAEKFKISNYVKQWGEHMLNSTAIFTTIKELASFNYDPKEMLFIRPDGDGKEFDGQVIEFEKIKEWDKNLILVSEKFTRNSPVLVSAPYNLAKEWRLYVVDGNIITGSQYREYFKLKKSAYVPDSVIEFASYRVHEYSPSSCFAIDICETGGELYIVECGCINSVGFYASDKKKLLLALLESVEKKTVKLP